MKQTIPRLQKSHSPEMLQGISLAFETSCTLNRRSENVFAQMPFHFPAPVESMLPTKDSASIIGFSSASGVPNAGLYATDRTPARLVGSARNRWHVVIVSELWRFEGAKAEPRGSKSLRVIWGKGADVVAWMRRCREQKLTVGSWS